MVERHEHEHERTRALDERAGREATREELRRHLTTAPSSYVRGAAGNPHVGTGEMLLLLRNRETPAPLLLEIGRSPQWTRYYRVQRALALHPRTPPLLGRSLVRHLYWKELVELSTAPHVNPVVRRMADRSLMDRFSGMALGERLALARRAGRGVIEALCRSDETPVLRALLTNPRTIEADAVRIAASTEAPPRLLAHLAEHPRWGLRRDVRLAMVRNAVTPVQTALGILNRLSASDLRRLDREPRLPEIICMAASRRLARGRSSGGREPAPGRYDG